MGMISDEQAFAMMVRSGEMVRVGVDRFGLPVYSHASAFSKPFASASLELSNILHAVSRPLTLRTRP